MAEADRGLEGREVAITGRLASMTRKEAVRRIEAAGGRYVMTVDAGTDLLAIGRAGLPLGPNGHPTRSVQQAQELRDEGGKIRLISEEELLSLLGLQDRVEELQRLYTTSQLARMLGVPITRVRSWVRADLIRPVKIRNRLCFFGFQQVGSARSLQDLLRSGVPLHQIRRGLERLGSWFRGDERRLLHLEALEGGGPLLVRLQDGGLAEPTGQRRLDFPTDRPSQPRPLRARAVDEWFEVGIREEEGGRLQNATEAYRKALATGTPRAEVCFNLGNTLYTMERFEEAAKSFAQATEIDPEYVEAWNNLGNALAEIHRPVEATAAYRRALSLEPQYADAHYNLAETLVQNGKLHEARQHFRAYLRLDPRSPEAKEVRRRLDE